MNVQLSSKQISEIETISTMSKRERLMRFARLIRDCAIKQLYQFSNVEHRHPADWAKMAHPMSAFAVAAADPILKDAGLKGQSVGEAVQFFSLSRDELHAFSCDCGGLISNEGMARTVEAIAARA